MRDAVERFDGSCSAMRGQTHERLRARVGSDAWRDLLADERGQDLVEYALLAALIGLGAATSLRGLATKIGGVFSSTGSTLTSSA